jgi:hypothetical protein
VSHHTFTILDKDGEEVEFLVARQDGGDFWVYSSTDDDPLGFDVLLDFKRYTRRGEFARFHVHEKDSAFVSYLEEHPGGWSIYKAPIMTRVQLPGDKPEVHAVEEYVRDWVKQFENFKRDATTEAR